MEKQFSSFLPIVWCLVFFSALQSAVGQHCANHCSGHGECNTDMQCECESDWDYAPDCSLQLCPTGTAWVDKAYQENTAHLEAECSNRGICDRLTGLCECFDGFTGQACQRVACPGACGTTGVCVTVEQAGRSYGADPDADGEGLTYANWDADLTTFCACDYGMTGQDCSLRMCPKGDDPLTIDQNYRQIRIQTNDSSGAQLSGMFAFRFEGETFEFAVNATAADMETYFNELDNVGEATVTKGKIDDTTLGTSYYVTFESWPVFPHQNNIYTHDGNPDVSTFTCAGLENRSNANATCDVTDVINSNLIEYEYCSRQGICNFGSGVCECFDYFSGLACENADTQVLTDDDADVLLLHAQSSSFAGNVLHMKTSRSASSKFYLLYAESNSEETLTVKGNGNTVLHKGGLTITLGGETITAGGLTITAGGQTIDADGLTITAGGETITAGGLTITADGETITAGGLMVTDGGATIQNSLDQEDVLRVESTSVSYNQTVLQVVSSDGDSSNYDLMKIQNSVNSIFTVSGTPKTYVDRGGMEITGGLTVTSMGATITSGGFTVDAGSATITQDLVVSGVITTSELYSSAEATFVNGLTATGGSTFTSGFYTSGDTTFSTGFTAAAGSTFSGDLYTAADTTFNAGLTANAGSTFSGDLYTAADTTFSTGFTATAGSTFSGDLYTSGQFTVTAELYTSGDVTFSTGFTAAAGSTFSGDLYTAADVTFSAGFSAAAGSTFSGDLYTAGVTTFSTGFTALTGTTFTADLYTSGQFTVTAELYTSGDVTFSTGFTAAAGSTFSGDLYTAGDTTFSTGFTALTGTTFTADLYTSGQFTVTAELYTSGDVTFSTGFTAAAGSTFSGDLYTAADATFNAGLTANAGSTFSGDLYTAGDTTFSTGFTALTGTTFTADLYTSGQFTVTAELYTSGDVTFSTGFTAAAGSTFSGDLYTTADVTFNAGFTANAASTITSGGLYVTGIGTFTGDVWAAGTQYTSDRRLKENIEPLIVSMDDVFKLQGVSFDWKEDQYSRGKQIGFIAQEVREIFPDVVKIGDDGIHSMNYQGLIPVMIEALKELQQAQDEKIMELEIKLNAKIRELEELLKAHGILPSTYY